MADAVLHQEPEPLPPEPFRGAGIYAIYYRGPFEHYAPLTRANSNNWSVPIYVGKAVPKGTRKGGFGLGADPGTVLFARLNEHAATIDHSQNLEREHFACRFLVVEDIWIPLGESLLIEMFAPLWNKTVDGFGIHDPGKGRRNQRRSGWDTLHPGRPWAEHHPPNDRTSDEIAETVRQALANI